MLTYASRAEAHPLSSAGREVGLVLQTTYTCSNSNNVHCVYASMLNGCCVGRNAQVQQVGYVALRVGQTKFSVKAQVVAFIKHGAFIYST